MSDSRADTEANEPSLVFPELMRVERWGETDTTWEGHGSRKRGSARGAQKRE